MNLEEKLLNLIPGTLILEKDINDTRIPVTYYMVINPNLWLDIKDQRLFKLDRFPSGGSVWEYEIIPPS